MKKNITISSVGLTFFLAGFAAAEDWAISSVGSCEVSAGNAVESGNGMRASGGTAVLKCPMTKRLGAGDSHYLYARINRSQSGGADPFCYLISTPPYGTSSDISYGYATAYVGAQSVNVPMPQLHLTGYLDLYCLLNDNDTLYGVRHVQVD